MTNSNQKYLIENELDNLWGLTVSCAGQQHIGRNEPYPPQTHPEAYSFLNNGGRVLNEHQLIYITHGRGVFRSAHCAECSVQAGDMLMLFPGERHSYHPDAKTGWNEYWIGFRGPNIDNRVANGFFQIQHPIFHIGLNEEVVHTYRRAISIANDQNIGYQQMLAGLVNLLLGLTFSLSRISSVGHQELLQQINQAKIIMQEGLRDNIEPETVASRVNMGYSKFRRVFKKYTGFAPFQYIQELRVQRSKELLAGTTLQLKNIAYEVGYDNADYFNTAFKRLTKMTPMAYRKMARK